MTEPEIVTVGAAATAVVRGVVPAAGIRDFFDSTFGAVGRVIGEQGLTVEAAFALYHCRPTDTFDLEAGFVVDRPLQSVGEVEAGTLPAGRVARIVHAGNYDGLGHAWAALEAWIHARGLTPGEAMWEVYLTMPTPEMDPTDLRTELSWPIEG